jgi:hypothetical protein
MHCDGLIFWLVVILNSDLWNIISPRIADEFGPGLHNLWMLVNIK